jgi:type I restriction enzyme S subunit
LIKRFRQAVLAAACSGRLTADWRKKNESVEPALIAIEKLKLASRGTKLRRGVPEGVPMSEVVADWDLPGTWGCYSTADLLRCGAFVDVKDGNHGANHPKVSEFTKTGLPFITAAQINNFHVDYDSAYKLAGEPLDRIHVGFAKPGDVIYTHKGSVGRVAIADRDCVLTPQTTYYRVNPKVFANGFVMFYLASQAFSEQANVVKGQTTRDFVPISEQYLLFHRVPPLPEQQEIVHRVKNLFALADRLEARFAEGQERVDSITRAILAKAFRGELVPTEFELAKAEGRSFESAEELLSRIKGNGQAEQTKTKRPIKK